MALTEQTQPYRLTLAWKDDGSFQGAEFYNRLIVKRDGTVISDSVQGPLPLEGSSEALAPFLDQAMQGAIDLAADRVSACVAALQRAQDAEEGLRQAQALALQKQGEYDALRTSYINAQAQLAELRSPGETTQVAD